MKELRTLRDQGRARTSRAEQSAAGTEAKLTTSSHAQRVAQALAAADLIDIDLRNAKAQARKTFRLTNPSNGKQLVNWEAREYAGVTLAAFADDVDTPLKAAKMTILKLKEKGLSVPENLYKKAGVVKLEGQQNLPLEYGR